MRHIEHDNGVSWLLDSVTDAPVLSTARGVLASVFILKRMTDAARVVKKRADDELGGRRGDLLRKTRELTLNARTHVKAPATASMRHAAPVLRSR